MTALVTLDAITFRAPDGRVLIEDLSLAFGRERTGLVGRNGVGKTTLLRIILGEIQPSAGAVMVTGRTAVLRQTLTPAAEDTLADILGVRAALARLELIERGEVVPEEQDHDLWSLPQRIEESLARIGLGGMELDRPATALSGGQATRAALAALIVSEADIILMDEPTNNLDVEARAIVADTLETWKGCAIVVSHDRQLLRRVDRIVELGGLGARVYGGAYGRYQELKAQEEEAVARDLDVAERAVQRVERHIQGAFEKKSRKDAVGKRARAKGGDSKMAMAARKQKSEETSAREHRIADRKREEAREDLEAARARVERVRRLAFSLPPSHLAADKQVLAFRNVVFAWPGRAPILDGLSFSIAGPERVAVIGPNGAGKSTLIRLAAGELEPHGGRIERGVRAVRLDQHASILEPGATLVENFLRLNPDADENIAHAGLARFVFRNVAALKTAGALSGGEKLRAALACVLMGPHPAQFVILDEPTNHLDLDSIAAIEAALSDYDGALLVASHDEAFLEAIGIERRIEIGG